MLKLSRWRTTLLTTRWRNTGLTITVLCFLLAVQKYSISNPSAITVYSFAEHKEFISSENNIEAPVFGSEIYPSTENNVFILETSNSTEPKYIKYRVLCGIE
ncbi:unnamed protein product, partial [Meganyctiphanes norvegica]